MKILSLMSGSSLDGLDIGVIHIDEINGDYVWDIRQAITIPYTNEMYSRLKKAYSLFGEDLIQLDFDYGRLCAELVLQYLDNNEVEIDCISFHGHTVFHSPEKSYTYQIGNCATLAGITQHKVVGDFRSTDVSLRGQGAPLMAIVDEYLFDAYGAYVNLGGISNISSTSGSKSIAYDISPCNQILNFFANKVGKEFDKDGKLASTGQYSSELFNLLSNDPYYNNPIPKSLDNNYIRENILGQLESLSISVNDALYTACRFIVTKLEDSFMLLRIKGFFEHNNQILFSGGGALNPIIVDELGKNQERLELKYIYPTKTLIEYKELLLMGFLAYLRLKNKSNILSKNTGSFRDTISGAIYGY